MKKNSVAKRVSAMLMALALLVSCVLTVSAGTAFTGDSSDNKVIVKLNSKGGGTINYNINGISSFTTSSYLSRNVKTGAVCTATAASTEAKQFMYWLNDFGNRIYSYEPTIEFIAASQVSYTAVFNNATSTQRMVQYVNYGGNTLLDSYVVDKGATVSQPKDPYAAGFTFRNWSSTVSEVNSSDETMIVTPVFDVKQETYTVEITNDAYVSGAGTYANYATVNLKADEKNGAGETFSYWKNSDDQIVSYERNYSFRINYNTTLTAVYGESVTPVPIIRISRIYRDPAKYAMTVFAERSVPDGYTVVSHGLLMSTSASVTNTQMTVGKGGNLPNSVVRKVYGNSTEPCGTFSLAKSGLTDSTTVTARAFLIYQDATGKEFIAYTDILHTTNAD